MLPSKVTFPILIIRQNNTIHFSQSEVGKSKIQVWEPRPHPLMRMPQSNLPNQSRSLKHRNSAPLGSPLGRVESKELGGSDTLKLPCLGTGTRLRTSWRGSSMMKNPRCLSSCDAKTTFINRDSATNSTLHTLPGGTLAGRI